MLWRWGVLRHSHVQKTTPYILAGSLSGMGVEVPGLSGRKGLVLGDLGDLREALRPNRGSLRSSRGPRGLAGAHGEGGGAEEILDRRWA